MAIMISLSIPPLGVLLTALMAGDIYVDPSSANCTLGSGAVSDPVCTLNAALAIAAAGDTIHVGSGIYSENLDLQFDVSLVALDAANPPELLGGIAAEGILRVAFGVVAVIDGFTLRDSSAVFAGGAITSEGDLTLLNSTLRGNQAAFLGGAIYAGSESILRVEGCSFTDNDCFFDITNGSGGAIYSLGELEVRNSTFDSNTSVLRGGAIASGPSSSFAPPASRVLIDNCVFFQNNTSLGSGGAVSAFAEEITLTNSTLASNWAGGYFGTYGVIWGAGGGAHLTATEALELVNCTVTGNIGQVGAGLRLSDSSGGAVGTLSHLTIVGNESRETYPLLPSTPIGVGGIATSGGFSILNSIVAGNTGYAVEDQDHDGGLISLGGNVIGIGTALSFPPTTGDQIGSVGSPLDPLLLPLSLNGGLTPTLAVQSGSPALDGGVVPAAPLSFDQRGFDRVRGSAPDAGAFEFEVLDSLCNGDGGTAGCTPCPCGNDAPSGTVGGCLNESGQAARLLRSGSSSISAQNLSFQADQLPPNVSALLISGAALAPANPANPCFGQASGVTFPLFDGLRCVVQNTFRHGVRASNASGSIGETQPGWGGAVALVNGSAFVSGQERHFQIFFRQNPAGSCSNGLGTSQAATVQFFP